MTQCSSIIAMASHFSQRHHFRGGPHPLPTDPYVWPKPRIALRSSAWFALSRHSPFRPPSIWPLQPSRATRRFYSESPLERPPLSSPRPDNEAKKPTFLLDKGLTGSGQKAPFCCNFVILDRRTTPRKGMPTTRRGYLGGGGLSSQPPAHARPASEYSRQNVDHHDRSRPREKRETERLAHSSAPHRILLNRHQ